MFDSPYLAELIHLVIAGTAGAGFLVAWHIHRKKQEPHPFVCPLHFDCHRVVTSPWSEVLGIPLEFLGMAYYSLVALSYLVFLAFPRYQSVGYGEAVLFVTIFAFFFSLYLTYIQAVRLRQWCSWCLMSAFFCAVIFIGVLSLSII